MTGLVSPLLEVATLLRTRWIPLLLLGLISGSLAEPVVSSVCATQAHPEADVVTAAEPGSGPVLDVHDGQPVEHPSHGSGADHCMHQHGLALGAAAGLFTVTSLGLTETVETLAVTPLRVSLAPPFHPPRT